MSGSRMQDKCKKGVEQTKSWDLKPEHLNVELVCHDVIKTFPQDKDFFQTELANAAMREGKQLLLFYKHPDKLNQTFCIKNLSSSFKTNWSMPRETGRWHLLEFMKETFEEFLVCSLFMLFTMTAYVN